MNLVPIDRDLKHSAEFLWEMLGERDDTINISHKKLPTWEQHWAHIHVCLVNKYKDWFLIEVDKQNVGQIYLTNNHEIGIFILKAHQGNGYGPGAVRMLMDRYLDVTFLANVNPVNERSNEMFKELGFRHIQNTYQKDPAAVPLLQAVIG